MDPASTQQSVSALNEPAVFAGLLALAMGMMELMKQMLAFVAKRLGGKKEADDRDKLIVQLDPEVSKMIHETFEKIREVHQVLGRVDRDGTPMVYSPRTGVEYMRDIASVIKDVHQSQERLAAHLEKIGDMFIVHDREERVTHNNMQLTLDRFEKEK